MNMIQFLALSMMSLLVIINAQTVTDSRFFMDDDNDAGLTALPIDVCFNSNGAPPTRYTRYTCNAVGTQVTKIKYSDEACTVQEGGAQLYENPPSCGLYSFSCTNTANNYMAVGAYFNFVGNDNTCQNLQSSIPSVIGCFCNGDGTSYTSFCSSNTVGNITTYTNGGCSGTGTIEDLSVCKLVDDSVINVYAKIAGCNRATTTDKDYYKYKTMNISKLLRM
mmetsp:Transcript_47481/g.42575  ORF Transcript_47481/g.42575 Transcript_47481/m.42575 type:complete len:221 (+) Transcript_47481:86-748(+)